MSRGPWWWLPFLFLPAAALAEQAVRTVDASAPRFWIAFAAVQVLSVFGWSASSLPELAKWRDTSGGDMATAERRLKVLQGLLISVLAGNIAYYGGYYYFTLAEIVCFIAASVAAWGGDKFLTPLLQRLVGIFGKATS